MNLFPQKCCLLELFPTLGLDTCAILSHGLYVFYPIVHCGLYCRAVNITDNVFAKKGNSSFLGLKSEVYNSADYNAAHRVSNFNRTL